MTTQLDFGNTMAAHSTDNTTNTKESTAAGSFDSVYCNNSISVPGGSFGPNYGAGYIETSLDASTTEYYFVGEFYCSGTGTNSNAWMAFYNSSGTRVAGVYMNGSQQMAFDFYNGSGYTASAFVSRPLWSTRIRVVVHIVCGVSGSYDVKVNGTSLLSGSITSASCNNIKKRRLYNGCYNTTGYWSQMMGADYDITNAHYMNPNLNGNSATDAAQSSGTYADVNETPFSDATYVQLDSSGNRAGFTHAAATVPAGNKIVGVGVCARADVTGAITDGKLGILSSGSRSGSTGRGYGASFGPGRHLALTDPATATAFSQSGFNNAEGYVEAV